LLLDIQKRIIYNEVNSQRKSESLFYKKKEKKNSLMRRKNFAENSQSCLAVI
jgi:hypothetical protein